MRKSNLFLLYLAVNLLLLAVMFAHASMRKNNEMKNLREQEGMVRRLELTDLCLFTEASYTRHLSQADLHTPFQDSPMALEHFPSGSLVIPPAGIGKRSHGKVD
jgi:hypothetical protein